MLEVKYIFCASAEKWNEMSEERKRNLAAFWFQVLIGYTDRDKVGVEVKSLK